MHTRQQTPAYILAHIALITNITLNGGHGARSKFQRQPPQQQQSLTQRRSGIAYTVAARLAKGRTMLATPPDRPTRPPQHPPQRPPPAAVVAPSGSMMFLIDKFHYLCNYY
jgi:hypothetical protein